MGSQIQARTGANRPAAPSFLLWPSVSPQVRPAGLSGTQFGNTRHTAATA